MTLQIDLLSYPELSKDQLYGLLHLRADVFVIEQQSLFQDIDGRDIEAWHVLVSEGEKIIAVSRILQVPDQTGRYQIGRVAVAREVRGRGLARQMMEKAWAFISLQDKAFRIELSAQEHLVGFYQSLGYHLVSDVPYDDAGIPHVDMVLDL
ncbi:GNAT family N-acetyltransferase [Kiloniella laminariae]|uniref:GNAT family N-acetyltransferase n=1 Tax=Kiloniella laminariae TaxID=454162 RepID=A0ABT4LNB1_9PROT|nr:GNAT family N-acetyltransferase [Kiloniella laminariae]MCZ4282611.1 GNAT family N-acetyltransferase [Kiloniella laminariae]